MHTDKISVRLHIFLQKTYADGSHPIILEFRINGVRKKKVLSKCQAVDWDFDNNKLKAKAKASFQINNLLRKELSNAEEKVYKIRSGDLSINDIFGTTEKLTLAGAMSLELQRLERENKSGFYDKILALGRQVDTSVILADIDKVWFDKQITTLRDLGNINNTIQKKIKLLRGIVGRYLNTGVTKEVRDIKVQTSKTLKIKLSAAELERIEQLVLPFGDHLSATRDLFLLQIYLRGVRVGDLLQASSDDFKEGRFTYSADKTGKELSVKLIPKAVAIVDAYSGKYNKLFPFFIWAPIKSKTKFENERARLKHKEVCTTIVNKHLKTIAVMCGITKPLSSHIARHTFARMAIDKINNPMITMDLLGHSSLAVHQSYLNDIRKDDELDKAADDIFG